MTAPRDFSRLTRTADSHPRPEPDKPLRDLLQRSRLQAAAPSWARFSGIGWKLGPELVIGAGRRLISGQSVGSGVSCYHAGRPTEPGVPPTSLAESLPGSARYMITWSPPGYGALSRWR